MQAAILMMSYPNDGRKLQRLIIGILKQWLAISINRLNYAKTYTLVEGKVVREEQKVVLIKTTDDKKEKLLSFLKKQHPQHMPELIWLPMESGEEVAMK